MELENVAKRYQHDILKKKYWDSMDVKWKVIKVRLINMIKSGIFV